MLLGLLLGASAMAAAAPAGNAANANVTAANVQSVVSALQRAGYKGIVKREEDGDPYIESASGGHDFLVLFYGCTKGENCATVQFYAGWREHKADLAKINSWNTENRFGRAYLTDEKAARVEMDVDLDDGGMSPALFEDNIEFWVAVMGKFERFIS